jgi:hypothetical protein
MKKYSTTQLDEAILRNEASQVWHFFTSIFVWL